jgi:NAD(P)-dependent dehydrogenase (short-subunit alcohol dehydrogenase family)
MRKVLLIGASSAIAKATAELLNTQGVYVIGISRKENQGYCNEWHQVESYSKSTLPVFTEPIDGLVYFPGSINLKPFHRIAEDDFQQDLTINTWGFVHSAQQYYSNLKQGVHPSVVVFSTVAVATGMPFHSSVALSKGALEGVARSLAAEWAPTIRVNVIAPSLTDTPLAEKLLSSEEKRTAAASRNPLIKVGIPSELADAVSFLINPSSAWITGHIMPVDGGMGALRMM